MDNCEKCTGATSKAPETDLTPTRRSFYSGLISALGSAMGLAVALPAVAYLLIGDKSNKTGTFVQAAKLTQLEVGKPREVTFERTRVDGWRNLREKVVAWVVRTDEKNVVAYAPQCTHLGCAYHWEEPRNQFVCPCHGSLFSIDGKVLGGPAARPLDRYAVRVDNSEVLIGSEIQKA
jgi:menaquinol-cytochrome c reductase iron-sulfur subunit